MPSPLQLAYDDEKPFDSFPLDIQWLGNHLLDNPDDISGKTASPGVLNTDYDTSCPSLNISTLIRKEQTDLNGSDCKILSVA